MCISDHRITSDMCEAGANHLKVDSHPEPKNLSLVNPSV